MQALLRILILVLFSISGFSQGLNNIWMMGYKSWAGQPFGGTRVDFLSGAINISYHPTPMNFIGTNGIMSDRSGNLLFSSNGIYVANAMGAVSYTHLTLPTNREV